MVAMVSLLLYNISILNILMENKMSEFKKIYEQVKNNYNVNVNIVVNPKQENNLKAINDFNKHNDIRKSNYKMVG